VGSFRGLGRVEIWEKRRFFLRCTSIASMDISHSAPFTSFFTEIIKWTSQYHVNGSLKVSSRYLLCRSTAEEYGTYPIIPRFPKSKKK
jgi:hypothetical protein